jgi:hypothetical protein
MPPNPGTSGVARCTEIPFSQRKPRDIAARCPPGEGRVASQQPRARGASGQVGGAGG